MNKPLKSTHRYRVGGSLSANHPTYVKRCADEQLYTSLKAGEFCYVLNARQMGKSSLLVRTKHRLEAESITCAAIDISVIGSQNITLDEWYGSFIYLLQRELDLSIKVHDWWKVREHLSPVQCLSEFIEDILLKQIEGKIVIFIDEIDSLLNWDFKGDFFALIRAFYDQRATHSDYQRLTFVFFGVATPYDLIQDKRRMPFNIGRAIKLQGFSLTEAEPLCSGLSHKADDPRAVLVEILAWTGGQPFLTQKLCRLVKKKSPFILEGDETQAVKDIAEKFVIERWEAQDSPEHLRTVRDRLLKSKLRTIRLLELYEAILQREKVIANNSLEQIELQLSGLVIKDGTSWKTSFLKVHNRIYKRIFNLNWVEKQLKNSRPYSEALEDWLSSNCRDKSKLLQGQALQFALNWSRGKSLGDRNYKFLNASQELERKKLKRKNDRKLAIAVSSAIFGTMLFWGGMWWKTQQCSVGQQRIESIAGEKTCYTIIGSSGEQTFLVFNKKKLTDRLKKRIESVLQPTNKLNRKDSFQGLMKNGNKAFREKNYDRSSKFFDSAREVLQNEPEPTIYLNNSNARLKGKLLTLAVAVPVDTNPDLAKEILRGVADAQSQFNENNGLNGRLLEILIAPDGSDDETGKAVAEEIAKNLVKNEKVLGVIGHGSSNSSQAVQLLYENANLPMVSPTSTSSALNNPVFFRTVPSDRIAGEQLADYASNILNSNTVIIFSDSNSTSNVGLQEAFQRKFAENPKREVARIVDLANLDEDIEIEEILISINEETSVRMKTVFEVISRENKLFSPQKNKDFSLSRTHVEEQKEQGEDEGKTAILLPSSETNPVALKIAGHLNDQGFKLLGSSILFNFKTLENGKDVEGMIVTVPWLPDPDYTYAQNAKETWGGQVSWRTAFSYDATQVLIKALSQEAQPTRETVLKHLPKVKLGTEETSNGKELRFFEEREPPPKLRFVQVVNKNKLPDGADSVGGYGFLWIDTKD